MTQRYYCAEPLLVSGQHVRLDVDESHHLLRVMRGEPGRLIQLIGSGRLFSAEVLAPVGKTAVLRLLQELEAPAPAPVQVVFGLPWIKGGKTEWVMQKLTELGAASFVVFSAQREVAQGKPEKIQKLSRVVVEACKQCGRADIPTVSVSRDLMELCSVTGLPKDHQLLLYEEERALLFSTAVRQALGEKPSLDQRLLVVSGPEGGFHPDELEKVRALVTQTSLGPRILRAETAPLAAASAILALSGAL